MMGSSVVARGCCYGALSAAAVAASAAAESAAFRTSFSSARQLPLVRRIGVVNGSYRKRMARCCGTKTEPDVPSMTATATTTTAESKVTKTFGPKFSFCPACGGPTEQRIPTGEHEPRAVCTLCGFVHYQNPKMVVGCLVEHEGKVLLCRRSIQPSLGLWTLPAGYMELGESAAEGAVRETLEEAQAQVQPVSLFAHLDIPFIGQSYIIFRARFKQHPHFSPGPESLECALFDLDQIPFDQIAFSSINVALKLYAQDYTNGHFKVHCGVIEKRPGASPSDPQGFIVRDYLST